MTVSRALRQGPKSEISEERVEQIRAIAQRLGYHPHTGARALVLRKTFNIGFCIHTASFNYYERALRLILRALQQRLTAAGYHLGFYYFEPGEPDFEAFLTHRRSVDAIVVLGDAIGQMEREVITASGIRAISFLEEVKGLPSLVSGLPDAACEAVDLVVDRGFKAATVLDMLPPGKQRKASDPSRWFVNRAATRGLEVLELGGYWDDRYDFEYAIRHAKLAHDLVDRLLAAGEAGRCVFIPQDHNSLRLLQMIEARGLVPGRDISVIGMGNIEPLGWGPWEQPRLTTFEPQREKIGTLLAELTMQKSEPEAKVYKIPALLVERSSLGRRI